jgi:hypothetical protein
MEINALLGELGNRIGLGNITLDENSMCRLIFDDALVVDIEALPDGKTFFLHSVVCRTPLENKGAFYEELMDGHLFGQATGGATFGLDKNHGEILLFQKFQTEGTDYQEFQSALEMFLNRLEHWKEKIASSDYSGDVTGTDQLSLMDRGIIRG